MSSKPHRPVFFSRGWLAGGLLLAAAATAQAAAGYVVTRAQERSVSPGMSQADVEQLLGRPEHKARYGNEQGPTWTYEVRDAGNGMLLFDVDFSGDGKVLSAAERIEEPGGD